MSTTTYRRITVQDVNGVTVVHFRDRKIIEDDPIQKIGQELFSLVETEGRTTILLSFSGVDFVSSAIFGKFITLDKKLKACGGRLKFSDVRPEIYEVFAIMKLNHLFDIKADEADAIAAF